MDLGRGHIEGGSIPSADPCHLKRSVDVFCVTSTMQSLLGAKGFVRIPVGECTVVAVPLGPTHQSASNRRPPGTVDSPGVRNTACRLCMPQRPRRRFEHNLCFRGTGKGSPCRGMAHPLFTFPSEDYSLTVHAIPPHYHATLRVANNLAAVSSDRGYGAAEPPARPARRRAVMVWEW